VAGGARGYWGRDGVGDAAQVGLPGQVAADEAIGVLDGALLPGMIRVAEEERDGQLLGDEGVVSIFAAIVGRGTSAGQRTEALDQNLVGVPSRFSCQLSKHDEAAETLNQNVQGLLVGEEQRVCFPVAHLATLIGCQGPIVDEPAVGHGAGMHPAAPPSRALLLAPPQVLVQLLLAAKGRLVDEGVDGFVVDHSATLLYPESAGDLLGRPALFQTQDDGPAQATVCHAQSRPAALAPSTVPPLCQVRQVASGDGVAPELPADGGFIPNQPASNLPLGEPVDLQTFVNGQVNARAHTTLLSS